MTRSSSPCPQPINIAMLTCNRPRITKISIEEIHRRTTTPHRMIVFDNGSDAETVTMLEKLWVSGKIDELVLGDENRGVHYGHNALLKEVQSDLYISTDNDIVPHSPVNGADWLSELVRLMAKYPEYGAMACRPHAMIGDTVSKMFAGEKEVVERHHVGAVLRIMMRQAVLDTGGWSSDTRPSRNHEERWICSRMRKNGWKVGYANVATIHLWGDPSLGEDEWGYDATMEPQDHGHREVWPPPSRFNWERLGISWETCR